MASDTKTRTILLADLIGSTSKVTRLETDQAAGYIHDATQPIENAIKAHDGSVIKFTGDGYLATFESADDALGAASDIRNHFIRQRYTPMGILLDGVRVIVNTSDVVVSEDDIIGDGVIVTMRLEKNVPNNHIWVTSATREVCSNSIFSFEDVGEVYIRGRVRPVHMYALQDNEASFIENDVTLLITELHHYIRTSESLAPIQLNDWLMKWGNLHREAVSNLKGRVRQFVADMALLTFETPDEAYHALQNLRALVKLHNERSESSLPPYAFKAGLCYGDLILSPTGVVGPLVNRTFEVLNYTPRKSFCMTELAYEHISAYKDQFEFFPHDRLALYKDTVLNVDPDHIPYRKD